jgi:putative endonuclease
MPYYVYILKCSDGTYYTGSTNNIEKRLIAHNSGKTGAKYTKSRRPVQLAHQEAFETKSEALKRENQIKRLTREQKDNLVTCVS